MRKWFVLYFLSLVCIILTWDQQLMINICLSYGMSEDRAKSFTADIMEECTLLNIDYKILFLIAIAETGLKNVYGDSGEAVGYFQLHEGTVQFVQYKYNLQIPCLFTDLIKNPKLQVQIGARYLHYLLTKYEFVDEAIKHWNGSSKYVTYLHQVSEYIERVYVK